MQRITWYGVALHGGPLPGYAASHGCVRLPYDFAEKLFNKTRIGMRVIISPNDAAPVEFPTPHYSCRKCAGRRGCAGACREARSRGRGGRQKGRRGEESRRHSGARGSIAHGVAAQAGMAQTPRRRRARVRRQGARRRKDGPSQGAGRGAEEEGGRQRRGSEDAARQGQGRREVEARRRFRSEGRRQGGRSQEGRRHQGGKRGEARARAGLGLHQPRGAEALRAAQHASAVAGRGRGVRCNH